MVSAQALLRGTLLPIRTHVGADDANPTAAGRKAHLSNNLADTAKSPERTIRYNQSRGVSIAAASIPPQKVFFSEHG
jgi:hypothetical protein